MQIRVDASQTEVLQVLEDGLAVEELEMLSISAQRRDPFAPQPHRDLPQVQTLVEFAALAIAGGIVHDVAKAAASKAIDLLKSRFGDKARAKDDDVDE